MKPQGRRPPELRIEALGRDLDAFSLFRHLRAELEPRNSFLLESLGGGGRVLYSFLGFNPDYLLKVRGKAGRVEEVRSDRGEALLEGAGAVESSGVRGLEGGVEDRVENRITAIDEIGKRLPNFRLRRPEIFPRQVFIGGYLGYLAYDIVAPWVGFKSQTQTPDVLLGMYTDLLIYDHKGNVLYHVDAALDGKGSDSTELVEAVNSYRARKLQTFREGLGVGEEGFESNTPYEEMEAMVEAAREHIFAGDIFQVVLSRRVGRSTDATDMDIYGALRQLNPSPYMYYLEFGDLRFVGSSPEALVALDGRRITTVPIAGTRRRGRDRVDEATMEAELKSDPKELAEHVMLVDLARNDVAKASQPGTMKASGLMSLKKYRHVMHLVTTVTGAMRTGANPLDVLKAVFPAGTVSGAPKLRAMEIIHELEKIDRGPYAGALGYLALNGDMDWAITIRTIQLQGREASVQAGAGIVADSQPKLEWLETTNKMRSLLKAVEMAEDVGGKV